MVAMAANKWLSHGSAGAVAHGECSDTRPIVDQVSRL
jgi:hypothetical protein